MRLKVLQQLKDAEVKWPMICRKLCQFSTHQSMVSEVLSIGEPAHKRLAGSIPPSSARVWHSGRFEHWLHVLPNGALREGEGGGSLLGCYQVRALDVAEVSVSEMIDDQVLERGIRLEGPLSCTVPGDLF